MNNRPVCYGNEPRRLPVTTFYSTTAPVFTKGRISCTQMSFVFADQVVTTRRVALMMEAALAPKRLAGSTANDCKL